jgi:hypothetical protein
MLYLEIGNKNVWVYGKVIFIIHSLLIFLIFLNRRNYVDRSSCSLETIL